MRAKGLRGEIQVGGIEIPVILIPAEAEHLGPMNQYAIVIGSNR